MSTSINCIKVVKCIRGYAVVDCQSTDTEVNTFFVPVNLKTTFFPAIAQTALYCVELQCHMSYDVSNHLGAPWYCNHITVVPLLPSVVYRNCKQRGICDLVFWIRRDTAPLTPKIVTLIFTSQRGSVAGSTAALQVRVLQPLFTVDTFHISPKPFPVTWTLNHCVTVSLFLPQCLEKKAQSQVQLAQTNQQYLITLLKGKIT